MICTSLQNKDFEQLLALLDDPAIEMAEIRLDRCPLTPDEVEELFSTADTPLIATCRVSEDMPAQQAETLLIRAIRAGAAFVSPFVGRLDDISVRGTDLIAEVAEAFKIHNICTEIIAASIRHPMHVTECALAGADIATVPYKVIEQMTKHPLTDQGIEKFRKDYEAVFGKE